MTRSIAQRTRWQHQAERVEPRQRRPSRQNNPVALVEVEGDQGGEEVVERRRRVSRKDSCSLRGVYEVIEDIIDKSARQVDEQYEGIE